jgi:glycerophosphoryl diester phosphodiesterase
MTKVIAHRGSGVGSTENTLRGMKMAVAWGVDGIEIDVRQSQDGVLVVIHDETLERTTNGEGLVRNQTLAQLKTLDAGEGEQIPTLTEVLEFLKPKKNLTLHIEIKIDDIEEQALQISRELGVLDRVVISSFLPSVLNRVRQLDEEVTTAYLYSQDAAPIRAAKKLGCMGLHPLFASVTPALVDDAKEGGLFINAWTVNFEEAMRQLIWLGVDGIITDDPPMLIDLTR